MMPASDRSPLPGDRVVSCTVPGRRSSDAVEIVTLGDQRTGVVVLDVRAARDPEPLRAHLAKAAHAALITHEPMHTLVARLRTIVCEAVAASVGIIAIRTSWLDGRVELLNAGMPPVACVLPDGRLLQFPALSADVGPRVHRAHPYELIPLTPGSVFVLASDGATAGSLEDADQLWNALGLPDQASALAQLTDDELAAQVAPSLGPAPLSEDATVAIVPTRRHPRSRSGIV